MLPRALKNARILTFGYNANVISLFGSTSSDRVLQHAQTLVAELEADRAVSPLLCRPSSRPWTDMSWKLTRDQFCSSAKDKSWREHLLKHAKPM